MENKDAGYWLNNGNEFYEAKNYEEAIKCYEKAANLDSNTYSTICKLYYAYIKCGNKLHNQAIIEQDESLLEKEFAINEKLMTLVAQNGYFGNAQEYDAFAIWGDGLYDLAKIKQDEKSFDEAEKLFKKAIDKYDKAIPSPWPFIMWGETLCRLAKIKQDKNLFDEAEDLFIKAIDKYNEATQLDQDNYYAFIRQGIAFINLAEIKQDEHNLYAKATKCFKETEKSILDIFVCLGKEEGEQIIKAKVLYPLLDFCTEDGNFFKEAIKKIKDISQEELNKYKEIYILSIFIISQLRINGEYEKSVAHYTKKTIAQEILFNKFESKPESKFRLGAMNNANDPTEGKTLLDYLFQSGTKEEIFNTEYRTFAGCFTFNYNSLNQFRLYGKDNNQEGTGLSLIFSENFFSKKTKMATGKDDETEVDTLMKKFGLENESKKYTLFRCIYIDLHPKTKQPISVVGQKEKYLFYREEDKETEKNYGKYKKYIDSVIDTIDEKMEELKKLINEDPDLDKNVIGQLLINLRYLTKNIAFKEEQECRIVKICSINEENKIHFDGENRMYIEYEPDIFYSSKNNPEAISRIKKVYFGPKATNIESFQDRLKINKLEGKIDCEKSENPLA